MYVSMYVCMNVGNAVIMHACMSILYMYIYMYECMNVRMNVLMHVLLYTDVYMYVSI